MARTTEWRDRAACAGLPFDLFFVDCGVNTDALKVCNRCPVAPECLEDALATDGTEAYGVRGGVSGKRRTEMRRARQRTEKASAA